MFTVANQKAIAFYFYPSMAGVRSGNDVQSANIRYVFHLKLNPI